MKRQFIFNCALALLLAFSPFISSSAYTYYNGDLASANGAVNWSSVGGWLIYSGGSWVSAVAIPAPSDTVYILNGSTVTMNSTASCYNLTVESGGQLYSNSSLGNHYDLSVYGTYIVCDGITGNPGMLDDLVFDIEGSNCTISSSTGLGTFEASRIRKSSITAPASSITNLNVSMSIKLRYTSATKDADIYNNVSGAAAFNVTFSAGYIDSLWSYGASPAGDISIDGAQGTGSGERSGTYIVNGTLIVAGTLYLTTNNTSVADACAWIINNGGLIKTVNVNANASGAATHTLTMNSGSTLQIAGTPFITVFSTTNDIYNLISGSTIEYDGPGAQTIDNNLLYANLTLSGGVANTKTAAGTLNINGNLNIVSPDTLVPNTAVNIGGNWTNYSTSSFKYSNSKVTFNGNSGNQTISTTGGEKFDTLVINSSSNVYLSSKATIESPGILTLTSGILYSDTAATNFYITILNGASVSGASNNSFVYGKVSRQGSSAFAYPVGKGSEYRPIYAGTLTAIATVIAQYFLQNPTTTYDTSKKTGIDHVSGVEYWTLVSGATVTADSIALQWDTYSGGVTDTANLLVAYDPTPNWLSLGHQTTTGNLVKGTLSSSSSIALTSGKTFAFTFGSSSPQPNNPLPVSLLSFTARAEQSDVLLSWTTASEINNDYFTIEKSADGNNYESIGEVKGAGTSTSEINYTFVDNTPLNGASFYRLKQTDYNGNYTYSQPIAIEYNKQQTTMITLFPNPATDRAYINITWETMPKTQIKEKTFTLHVFDISGREAMPQQTIHFAYGMLQALDVTALPKGVYLLELNNDTEVQRTSLVKQ